MRKSSIFLHILLALIITSCGKGEEASSVTGKIGTSLLKCASCKFTTSEKNTLKNLCENFQNKIHGFKNSNTTFDYTIAGSDCTGGVITPPNDKLYMKIHVATSSFEILDATTATKINNDFESFDYGLLKTLCAKKDDAQISAQVEEGNYLYSYDFFNNSTTCKHDKYRGSCFMVNKALKTVAGQYIVISSKLLSVVKDVKYPQLEGVVFRREEATSCADGINSSHITQQFNSAN